MPLLGKQIPVTGNPRGLRFYGVCECDDSLLILFGDNRLLSTKEAGPPLRTIGISLVAQKWSSTYAHSSDCFAGTTDLQFLSIEV